MRENLTIYPFIYLSIHLYLSIYLSIYLPPAKSHWGQKQRNSASEVEDRHRKGREREKKILTICLKLWETEVSRVEEGWDLRGFGANLRTLWCKTSPQQQTVPMATVSCQSSLLTNDSSPLLSTCPAMCVSERVCVCVCVCVCVLFGKSHLCLRHGGRRGEGIKRERESIVLCMQTHIHVHLHTHSRWYTD